MSFCFVRASSAALFVLSALLCTVGVSATLGAEMELFAVPSRIRFSKPLVGTSGPSGRYGGALIPVGEESFYLIGGCTIRGDGTKELHNDMWQLNLGPENSVEWVELEASAPWAPRMLHAVAQLDDGSLLLSGGETQEGLASDVWQYSPEMNQWSLVIDSAPWKGRAGHVMAVAEDYVYLSGGFVNQRTEGNCDLWRASLYSLERWKMISSYSAAKTCPVLSGYAVPPRVAASQTISMFGGRSVRMVDSQVTFHNSEWSVTPSDMSFSGWRMVRGKARWEPRFAPGVAANGDTVVLVGGQVCKTASASQKGCESEPLADVWVRMKGLEWIPAPEDLPKPVAFPAVATLTNKIVVFGGRGKDGTSDDMYITCDYGYQVDPSGWDCQLCPNGTLPGRYGVCLEEKEMRRTPREIAETDMRRRLHERASQKTRADKINDFIVVVLLICFFICGIYLSSRKMTWKQEQARLKEEEEKRIEEEKENAKKKLSSGKKKQKDEPEPITDGEVETPEGGEELSELPKVEEPDEKEQELRHRCLESSSAKTRSKSLD